MYINRAPARSVPMVKQRGGDSDLNIMQAEIMQGGGRKEIFLIIAEDYISVAAWWRGRQASC